MSSSGTINYNEAISATQNIVSSLSECWNEEALVMLPKETWDERLDGIKALSPPKTIVAVFGSTGAGKSSLLNALLGDNIVPTSGVDACTSAVTQISYHDKLKIEADIEFISGTDWEEELTKLLEDVRNGRPGARDSKAVSSQAYERLRCLYPLYTDNDFRNLTAEKIFENPANEDLHKVLGTTKHISSDNAAQFAIERATYMQSRVNNVLKKERNRVFWPVVRMIHIRCRSPVLQSGAVLVDLPGVADQCSARNDIATQFMRDCTCFWIATPITRAIDDKVAHDLLMDESTMKQLQNGRFGPDTIAERVAFIATKCDSDTLDCDELVQNLGLQEDREYLRITNDLNEIVRESGIYKSATSASPSPSYGNVHSTISRKRQCDDEDSWVTPTKKMKSELLDSDGDCRMDMKPTIYGITQSPRAIRSMETRQDNLQKELKMFCMKHRQEYCSHKLQDNFRSELKRYDDDTAEAENPEEFDPDENIRDYSKITLPVFLCSSRDYNNMRAKSRQDNIAYSKEEFQMTGIPELQRHCYSIAATRNQNFLNELHNQVAQFTRTVRTCLDSYDVIEEADKKVMRERWSRQSARGSRSSKPEPTPTSPASGPASYSRLVKEENGKNILSLQDMTKKAIETAITDCAGKTKTRFKAPVRKFLKQDVDLVVREAPALCEKLAQEVHQGTFGAIIRRDGKYGAVNLNERLSLLLFDKISGPWEKSITSYNYNLWRRKLTNCVLIVINDVITSAPASARDSAKEQKEKCTSIITPIVDKAVDRLAANVEGQQKRLTRDVKALVERFMKPMYVDAKVIAGKGSVAKKKLVVIDYVTSQAPALYAEICETLMRRLDDIVVSGSKDVTKILSGLPREVEASMSTLWNKRPCEKVIMAQSHATGCIERITRELAKVAHEYNIKREEH